MTKIAIFVTIMDWLEVIRKGDCVFQFPKRMGHIEIPNRSLKLRRHLVSDFCKLIYIGTICTFDVIMV